MNTNNRAAIHVTRTGLQIGGHFIPPAPQLTEDAEQIQRVLLRRRLISSHEFSVQRLAQLRAESRAIAADEEWPPLNRKTLAIALVVVVASVMISAWFPMGVLTR